jgi:hypothetical protein
MRWFEMTGDAVHWQILTALVFRSLGVSAGEVGRWMVSWLSRCMDAFCGGSVHAGAEDANGAADHDFGGVWHPQP